jgi:predicted RNA-binding Zn-ribbon protein involved in translation (DUF1610 family)
MKTRETDAVRKQKVLAEDAEQDYDAASGSEISGKSMVECICPGCGKLHVIKLHWSGRGVCRKFCQVCRDRQTPIDTDR